MLLRVADLAAALRASCGGWLIRDGDVELSASDVATNECVRNLLENRVTPCH